MKTEPEFDSNNDLSLNECAQHFNRKFYGKSSNLHQIDDCLLDGFTPPLNIKKDLEAVKLLEKYFLCYQDVSIWQGIKKKQILVKYYGCSKRYKFVKNKKVLISLK